MPTISALNKRLGRLYGGKVFAAEENGCLHLRGELSDWQEIVQAGLTSVDRRKYLGLVNEIRLTGVPEAPARLPSVSDSTQEGAHPDVLVIGGGIIGCSIARELTRYHLDVLLIEKEHDLAMHASGRNDGMVHPGVDLRKGQVKKKYNDLGNRMFGKVCKELGVPFRPVGQYLCFMKGWWKPFVALTPLYWKAMKVPVRYVSRRNLKKREPCLSDQISCALLFPTAGVVCPYDLTVAFAENAVDNGAVISLDTAALDMTVTDRKIESVSTNRGRVYPKMVINAAGVFSEEIAKMAQDHFFSIHPRKGTNVIFDKKAAYQVRTVASSLGTVNKKTSHSKGGGIVHTVDGNLLVGPDAIETREKENFETTRESIKNIIEKQRRTSPGLDEKDIITYFTGIRAASYEEDFIITYGKFTSNLIHAAGIQSPGITAAPAIAVDIADMAAKYLGATNNEQFDPIRVPIPHTADMARDERDALIRKDESYGIIVCRCEEVSRGEIRDALHRSIPCDTVDGVKRRVRPGMGRCQGGFCGPLVAQIIAEELKIPVENVRKNGYDGYILLGSCKGETVFSALE
jgi:glycerol-3-phosphate dehydrogenase